MTAETSVNREAGVAQRLGRAAGRDQRDAARGQRLGEIDQAGLVGNGKERAADGAKRHGILEASRPRQKRGSPVLTSGTAKREASERR